MLSNGEQVPVVAGYENVHRGLDRTGKDKVVIWVSRHPLGRILRRWSQLDRKIDEKLLDLSPALLLEAQLLGEDPLQLDHHWLGQDELKTSIDRLLEDAAGRSGGDERRHEDVGVAGDPQDQPRPERISSIKASLSSGPTPRASARSRP